MEIIGKTGTTSDAKDVWFMGASPDLATGVWMGYDQPKPLGYGSAGGRWCGPVFADFMRVAVPYWKSRPDKADAKAGRRQARDRAATLHCRSKQKTCQRADLHRDRAVGDQGVPGNCGARIFGGGRRGRAISADVHARRPTRPRTLDNGAERPRAGDLGFDPAREGEGEGEDAPVRQGNRDNVPVGDGFPPASDAPPMSTAPTRASTARL